MVVRGLLFSGVLLCTLLSVLLSSPAFAVSQLEARLDKNPVMLGESVLLEVTANSRLPASSINFRVLDNNFTVMVPSVNQSTRVINGDVSHSTVWTVTLLPKASGSFTIPAFTVDNVSSQPIKIEVLPVQQGSGTLRDVFLQSKVSSDELMVQQMVYYDVTIYFSGDIQRGSLSEPQLDDALIQQVGQDQEGTELIDGERYRSITRRYAITPQRSGEFTIAPPTFTGDVIDRDSARQSYFARSRTIVREAEPLSITVQPQPAGYTGDWLVAGLVTLNEEWQPDQQQLTQGEPVTRIITLSAVDVSENQLPELNISMPDGFRVYQEQPQARGAERSGRLVAQKVITSAIIANTAGEFELPEVKISWWNSQTDRLEQTVLPGRTVQVQANPNRPATPTIGSEPAAPLANPTPLPQSSSNWNWNYTSSALLSGWLLTLALLIWRQRQVRQQQPQLQKTARSSFDSKSLRSACNSNNKAAAREQLLLWARHQRILSHGSLTTLSQQLSPGALKEQVTQLNAALYSDSAVNWQGTALFQAWADYRPVSAKPQREDQLAPLYPE
ncbi:BatD family protein [Arsukibacterium indicum]|uniref:BatD family protein n=1 Tax=Arsukibacterium indicum TaxID=2848612 RepID=A0ABS6MFW4_9GAMM|nr:BatD family protein [Arsukibacterium indicum]MBV2127673.1 BatD family protein [Arsukibacterium indicum]